MLEANLPITILTWVTIAFLSQIRLWRRYPLPINHDRRGLSVQVLKHINRLKEPAT